MTKRRRKPQFIKKGQTPNKGVLSAYFARVRSMTRDVELPKTKGKINDPAYSATVIVDADTRALRRVWQAATLQGVDEFKSVVWQERRNWKLTYHFCGDKHYLELDTDMFWRKSWTYPTKQSLFKRYRADILNLSAITWVRTELK